MPIKWMLEALIVWVGGINSKFFDLVEQGFVADIQNFNGLSSIPARFFKNVGNDFSFNSIHRLFADFF